MCVCVGGGGGGLVPAHRVNIVTCTGKGVKTDPTNQ